MKAELLVLAAGAVVLSAGAEEPRVVRTEGYDAPRAWAIMPLRGEEMRMGCFGGPSDIKALEAMPDLAMFRNIWIGLPGPLGVAEFTGGPETNCIRRVAGTPDGAPAWVASDFRTLGLLTRIFEAAWRGELAAKRPSLEAEYRGLWTENNRPGGLEDSVRQVLCAETHN